MNYGWSLAAILYALPVLSGIRHYDESLDDCKQWMRDSGEWYPGLAHACVLFMIFGWPIWHAFSAFGSDDRDPD